MNRITLNILTEYKFIINKVRYFEIDGFIYFIYYKADKRHAWPNEKRYWSNDISEQQKQWKKSVRGYDESYEEEGVWAVQVITLRWRFLCCILLMSAASKRGYPPPTIEQRIPRRLNLVLYLRPTDILSLSSTYTCKYM